MSAEPAKTKNHHLTGKAVLSDLVIPPQNWIIVWMKAPPRTGPGEILFAALRRQVMAPAVIASEGELAGSSIERAATFSSSLLGLPRATTGLGQEEPFRMRS
jgi:hypothetical protein